MSDLAKSNKGMRSSQAGWLTRRVNSALKAMSEGRSKRYLVEIEEGLLSTWHMLSDTNTLYIAQLTSDVEIKEADEWYISRAEVAKQALADLDRLKSGNMIPSVTESVYDEDDDTASDASQLEDADDADVEVDGDRVDSITEADDNITKVKDEAHAATEPGTVDVPTLESKSAVVDYLIARVKERLKVPAIEKDRKDSHTLDHGAPTFDAKPDVDAKFKEKLKAPVISKECKDTHTMEHTAPAMESNTQRMFNDTVLNSTDRNRGRFVQLPETQEANIGKWLDGLDFAAASKCRDPNLGAEFIPNDYAHQAMPPLNQRSWTAPVATVDGWIDALEIGRETVLDFAHSSGDVMTSLLQSIVRLNSEKDLPPVVIPKFDGNPLDWPKFIEMFHDQVHSKAGITDNRRMNMLQSHLDGDAKRFVHGLGYSGRYYATVLKELKRQFGHRHKVARAYLEKVTSGSVLQSANTAALRTFYTCVRDCITTLGELGYLSDITGTDVLMRAARRIPRDRASYWNRSITRISKERQPNLIDLRDWLEQCIATDYNPYAIQLHDTKRDAPGQAKNKTMLKTGLTSDVTSKEGGKESSTRNPTYSQPPCLLCKEFHPMHKCLVFTNKTAIERKKDVRRLNLCYNCLKPHRVSNCKSIARCRITGCGGKHHTMIHIEEATPGAEPAIVSATASSRRDRSKNSQAHFQLIPVYVISNGITVKTVALLDSASEITVINESLARQLNLKGRNTPLTIQTLNSESTKMSKVVSFKVKSMIEPDARPLVVKKGWTVASDSFLTPPQQLSDGWGHLSDLPLRDIDPSEVQLLIGVDVPQAHLTTEVRVGSKDQPLGVKTCLGWSIMGVAAKTCVEQMSKKINVTMKQESDLLASVEQFWKTESFGAAYDDKRSLSVQDRTALKQLQEITKLLPDGHYEAPMLWRMEDIVLPNNLATAQRRYYSLEKRLGKDSDFRNMYCKTMRDYIAKGHAVKLSHEEALKSTRRTWYIPHHGVTNPNKPGKVRVVFDAAAEYQGASLNNSLVIGPDLLSNLFGMLQRFRLFKVAFVADIEGMFHQVRVTGDDSDSLRFLWKEDPLKPGPPDVFKMVVHIFGAKDSPTCANNALKRTAEDNRDAFSQAAVDAFERAYYVDDLLKSLDCVPAAIRLVKELIELAKKGGWRLHKVMSNSSEVLQSVPEAERAIQPSSLNLHQSDTQQRALGVKWDIHEDSFLFNCQLKLSGTTKRTVISAVSTIFDPCGYLAPYTVRAKCIIQDIWRKRLDWDEPIPPDIAEKWLSWISELPTLSTLRIPRHHHEFSSNSKKISLHVFSDASEIAFGAVANLRYTLEDGRMISSFLAAKTHIAPIKPQHSIPRLELQGSVLAVRLANALLKELYTITSLKTNFRTDSTTVLAYIRNETKRFKPFVSNRVSEIQESTRAEDWRYIPTTLNPADLCTRGMKAEMFSSKHVWYTGPQFLSEDQESWPKKEISSSHIQLDTTDPEVKSDKAIKSPKAVNESATIFNTGKLNDAEISPNSLKLESLVKIDYFSTWRKLIRRSAWIMRACRNFSSVLQRLDATTTAIPELTANEWEDASNYWVQQAQKEAYPEEWKRLTQNEAIDHKSPLLLLSPYYEGMHLRVGGRLRKADISVDAKHQLLLPPSHKVTNLLLNDVHVGQAHCGREHLVAEMRQKYWPVHARSGARRTINDCVTCRRRRLKPVPPMMADLPTCRLDASSGVFNCTGVDYFGPMIVKQRRSSVKRWGCLFTCLSVRAVHLELADSLSTDDFILCLRRFIGRRGNPSKMFSDNGTNFVGAVAELKHCLQMLNQIQICRFLSPQKIEWHFNPPVAPHFGGAWESLVKSVKRALKSTLADVHVTESVLRTALVEVEAVVNNRPLTYASSDVNDLQALTPNNFIFGRTNYVMPPCQPDDRDVNSRQRWRQVQVVANRLCQRWLKEYLPNLTLRAKWQVDGPNVGIGDLVTLVDDQPRGTWTLARIVDVYPGDDGIVRTVKVKTKDKCYVRPVARICVLEESTKTEPKWPKQLSNKVLNFRAKFW